MSTIMLMFRMNKEKKNNESLKNTQKYNAYVSSMMKQAKK